MARALMVVLASSTLCLSVAIPSGLRFKASMGTYADPCPANPTIDDCYSITGALSCYKAACNHARNCDGDFRADATKDAMLITKFCAQGRHKCLQVAKQTWAAQSKAKKGAWWAKKVNQFASNSGKYNSWEAWLAGHTGACTEAKLTANKCYSDVYEKLPKQSNPFDTECRAITCA